MIKKISLLFLFFICVNVVSSQNCTATLSDITLDEINGVTGIGFHITNLNSVDLTQFFIDDICALTPAKNCAIYSGGTLYVLTDCNMWNYAFKIKGNKTYFTEGKIINCKARFYCDFTLTNFVESNFSFRIPFDYCLKHKNK